MKPFPSHDENHHAKRLGTAALVASLAAILAADVSTAAEKDHLPNVVVILADDLGYGDLKCLNPEGKIATPHIDRLAAEGMIFSDAHSGSAVCTPTRYGLLTGRYAWRSKLKQSVLWGYSRPLIEPGRLTIARLAKQSGYITGCVGKWHLGMDIPLQGGGIIDDEGQFIKGYAQAWDVDYSGKIRGGPNAQGFDYYFGIDASLDMPPFVFVENDRFTGVPTREKKIVRPGPAVDDFEAVNVLPTLTEKAIGFIDSHAAEARDGRPLFLYFPLTAPHDPIAPSAPWRGRSRINTYADFVMQIDDTVGQIVKALEKGGLADNTLLIVTSDNGCSPVADFATLAAKGHNPNYVFRGAKADVYEGGHRVPFVVRWPGKVEAGTKSEQVICLNDLMATFAGIVGAKFPEDAAEDSVSFLPVLLGETRRSLRETIVHHSINGSFAIRQGNWKLALCGDSGGWSAPLPGSRQAVGFPDTQLYDLANDLGERKNVYREHPEIVKRLTALLEEYVADGRSTPGAKQRNTTPVRIRP